MTHPSPEAFGRFRTGSLADDELRSVGEHLAGCAVCRRQLGDDAGVRRMSAALRLDFERHLSFDELAALADGDLDSAIADDLRRHIAGCPDCRLRLDDLTKFAAAMRDERRQHVPMRRYAAIAAAAIIAVAIAAGVWLLRSSRPTSVSPPVHRDVVSLHDGPHPIAASPAGLTVDYGRGDWTAAVSDVLRSRVLPSAPEQPPSNTLRGGSGSTAIPLREPVGIAVAILQPRLVWSAAPDQTYEVNVTDEKDEIVARVRGLRGGEWIVTPSLRHGASYNWQVRTASSSSAAASFRVISAGEARDIDAARREGSHLLAAVLLARAGAGKEATTELDAFRAQNGNVPLVREIVPPRH